MKTIAAALGLAAALVAAPALADPAATPAAPATPSTSIGALLSAGYEVHAILDINDEEQKSIWPNDAVEPYIMVTLQKGTSIAVCSMTMSNWLNLSPGTLADATLCRQD